MSTVESVKNNIVNNKIVPMPFTIATFMVIIAVVIAKNQKKGTFISGSLLAFASAFAVMASIVMALFQMNAK
jgi:hypothetical protein